MSETILAAFIVARVKGYKLKPLLKSKVIYPIIVLEIIFFIGQIMIFSGNYNWVKLFQSFKSIYLISYLVLVFKYEIYGQAIIGSVCVCVGGILNDIAIKANGGFMPVFPSISYITGYVKNESFKLVNDIHILGNSQTNLKVLTDYIDLGYSVLSIGDILIRVFVFIIVYSSIKISNKEVRQGDNLC